MTSSAPFLSAKLPVCQQKRSYSKSLPTYPDGGINPWSSQTSIPCGPLSVRVRELAYRGYSQVQSPAQIHINTVRAE